MLTIVDVIMLCDPGDGCAGECADERGGSAQSADREQAGAGAPGNGPAPAAGPANQVHACLSFLRGGVHIYSVHILYTHCVQFSSP